jgi:hypothetical protein
MNAQDTVQSIRMEGWAQQIQDCQQSGLSVRQWCDENGVGTKTYYYRRKRVREELLEGMDTGNGLQLERWPTKQAKPAVFAALPMPRRNNAAVTVQIGSHIAEIHNGADTEIVESVLRTLVRL